ncbi:complex I subunit 5 family protein [Howardella ureilytica]
MPFIYNVPFISILLMLIVAMMTPFIRKWGKAACTVNLASVIFTGALNAALLVNLVQNDASFTYMMGHFPAPFGNELKAGPYEALIATVFCFVMALSIIGGLRNVFEDVKSKKQYLYFIMLDLLLCSLLALTYTNDMFTGYVFIEINTIASCAIVMAKDSGKTIVATTRYMIMSAIGSGLFLLGISMLYGITGHLLMEHLGESVRMLWASGQYTIPLVTVIGIVSVAIAIKSALYPFHSWLPSAHASATSTSSSILSGLVLKGYIVLLIKSVYRVFTPEIMQESHIADVLLVLGVLGMMMGSVNALRERHLKRMAAYSSVAQIGYIFMGIGINSEIGIIAATLHIISHAITKPMLFLSATGLANVSGHSYDFKKLRGAAHKNKLAGIAFTIGGLSMIGIPLFAGFVSKLFFSVGAIESDWFRLPIVLVALAVSTALNAVYYLGAIINIWRLPEEHHEGHHAYSEEVPVISTPVKHVDLTGYKLNATYDHKDVEKVRDEAEQALAEEHAHHDEKHRNSAGFVIAMVLFIASNFGFGIFYEPIVRIIQMGIKLL